VTPDAATIRLVERADLLTVVRIERACFDDPWPYDAFERLLDAPAFLVAECGREVCGYVVADEQLAALDDEFRSDPLSVGRREAAHHGGTPTVVTDRATLMLHRP